MKNNAKNLIKEFKTDLKDSIKELFNKKTFYRQIPNLLTIIRALAPIPFNILYFCGNLKGAIIILAIAFFTDSIDGKIARKYDLVSRFGANLDAICDKLMVIGVIIPICSVNKALIINLILEIIIAVTNSVACILGLKASSSKIGKFKTWPLFITIILAYLNVFIDMPSILITFLITITTLLQVLTTLDYISKNVNRYLKTVKKEA